MTPEYLLSELVAALRPEGSDLLIQKANSENLDWTFRVRFNNGVTGGSVSATAASLEAALEKVLSVIWAAS
jgi:hypothetical protein